MDKILVNALEVMNLILVATAILSQIGGNYDTAIMGMLVAIWLQNGTRE